MATSQGIPLAAVIRSLAERRASLDFFWAVRCIQCALPPGAPRIGASLLPKEDAVVFGQRPSMAISVSQIAGFEKLTGEEGRDRYRLLVTFFGLFGTAGPMPVHLSEIACRKPDPEGQEWENSLMAFANLFQDRLIAMLYRAWDSCQRVNCLDRPCSDVPWADWIGSVIGLPVRSLEPGATAQDDVLGRGRLFYAGWLAMRSRCAEGLERILEAQFGLRFRLRPFVGRWLKRSAGEPSVIGARLGRSTILGDRVWDVQSKFRLELGPVSLKDFRRFLPKTGKDWAALKAWVNSYVGLEFDWDLHLVLDPAEVPAFRLSRDPQQGVLLGVTTWQKSSPSRPLGREADDLIIDSFR